MSHFLPTARRKLAAVLELLSSDKPGERQAAAEAAHRLVTAAGLRWGDLLRDDPQPDPGAPAHLRRDWRRAADWCLRHGGPLLRPKDRDFLTTIAGYQRRPSEAQLVWLEGLVTRTLASGGA